MKKLLLILFILLLPLTFIWAENTKTIEKSITAIKSRNPENSDNNIFITSSGSKRELILEITDPNFNPLSNDSVIPISHALDTRVKIFSYTLLGNIEDNISITFSFSRLHNANWSKFLNYKVVITPEKALIAKQNFQDTEVSIEHSFMDYYTFVFTYKNEIVSSIINIPQSITTDNQDLVLTYKTNFKHNAPMFNAIDYWLRQGSVYIEVPSDGNEILFGTKYEADVTVTVKSE